MKWAEVFEKHKKISPIHTEDTILKSLSFSNDRRRTRRHKADGENLYFHLTPSHPKRDIEALKSAMASGLRVPVYKKISPNKWEDIGLHIVKKYFERTDDLGRPSLVFLVSPG
jgi:hypothetical protein